jgi:TRAP-type C4-dicarboxylate transport system permease small subunit
MMGVFDRMVEGTNRAVGVVIIACYTTLLVDVAAGTVSRFVNAPIVWSEELARDLFVWITVLAAGRGVAKNVHIGVDFFVHAAPRKLQDVLTVASYVGVAILAIVLIVTGLQLSSFGLRSRSMLLDIPMAYLYFAVPAGAFVILMNTLHQLAQVLRRSMTGAVEPL